MTQDDLEIREHTLAERLVQYFFAELDRELAERYPAQNIHGLGDREASAALVAWRGNEPLGCGVLSPLAPGVGEVKRMYVRKDARRMGVARRILAELERRAVGSGCPVLRLECGTLQPEAVALYEALGYRRIPRFGEYAEDPYSVCLEKRLTRGPA